MELPMTYALTIIQKPAYLHATITGTNSKENVVSYLSELLQECMARGTDQLLIEERLDGPRVSVADVFQIASKSSGPARGHFKKIAYIDVNAVGDLMKFAETVAVNRGLPVKVFASVLEADKWLQEP